MVIERLNLGFGGACVRNQRCSVSGTNPEQSPASAVIFSYTSLFHAAISAVALKTATAPVRIVLFVVGADDNFVIEADVRVGVCKALVDGRLDN